MGQLFSDPRAEIEVTRREVRRMNMTIERLSRAEALAVKQATAAAEKSDDIELQRHSADIATVRRRKQVVVDIRTQLEQALASAETAANLNQLERLRMRLLPAMRLIDPQHHSAARLGAAQAMVEMAADGLDNDMDDTSSVVEEIAGSIRMRVLDRRMPAPPGYQTSRSAIEAELIKL